MSVSSILDVDEIRKHDDGNGGMLKYLKQVFEKCRSRRQDVIREIREAVKESNEASKRK
jgi:hypothetical protein